METTLAPGDCLYLPRGFIHSAVALGETSIHLTFGIHVTTQRDVVKALLDAVLDDRWRAPMPAGWRPAAEDLADLRQRAIAALAGTDLDRVADALTDTRAARQRPEPVSPLAQADLATRLDATTRLRLRRHLNARLTEDGLRAGGRLLPLTADERQAVALLLDGADRQVADLPLPQEPAMALARHLLRAGVLVPAGPAE
jgi:ribosomal protein L16 Arg81 hydroxylase